MSLEKQAKTTGDIFDWFRIEVDNIHLHYCGVPIVDKIQKLRGRKWVPLEVYYKDIAHFKEIDDLNKELHAKIVEALKIIDVYDGDMEILNRIREALK
jgi:hypothetical protein